MEFKGTKGKWSVWRDDLVITEEKVQDDVICIKPQIKQSQKNWKANALLISKAPEMLEMLIEVMETTTDKIRYEKCKKLIKEATEL